MTDLTHSFPATPILLKRLINLTSNVIASTRSQSAERKLRISDRISDYEPGGQTKMESHDWAGEARIYKDRHMTWL